MHNDLCQFKIKCVYVNMLLFYKYAKMKGCHLLLSSIQERFHIINLSQREIL